MPTPRTLLPAPQIDPDGNDEEPAEAALPERGRFEKVGRHWAALENFGSQRIAIPEKYYRDNDRLLEGGIWAEVILAFNEIEDEHGIAKDASQRSFFVNAQYEGGVNIPICSYEDIEKAMPLVRQAHARTSS